MATNRMNNNRRKEIKKIIEQLKELQSRIEDVRDDEQDSLDNIPESLQESERYETSEAALENLDVSVDTIEELINILSESAV